MVSSDLKYLAPRAKAAMSSPIALLVTIAMLVAMAVSAPVDARLKSLEAKVAQLEVTKPHTSNGTVTEQVG